MTKMKMPKNKEQDAACAPKFRSRNMSPVLRPEWQLSLRRSKLNGWLEKGKVKIVVWIDRSGSFLECEKSRGDAPG